MKTQIVVIHGGDSFDTYEEYLAFLKEFEVDLESLRKKKWKDSLQKELGADFDVIALKMPNAFNARYAEWKLWFEKYIPLLDDEVILLGHSQGGIFLAKYLSENKLPKKIKAVLLVSAPYDYEGRVGVSDFHLAASLSQLEEQTKNIYLYHSKDDDVCPFADFEKYKNDLPTAHT